MNKLRTLLLSIIIALSVAGIVMAFTGPGSNLPPNGDPAFWRLSGTNMYYNSGNVGIGTSTPGAKLEVVGQVKITGGLPGANKVLTSDASGLGTWQAPAGTPAGGIIMYSGAWNFDATGLGTGALAGWALCNGGNGTPDLSNRFVMGTVASPTPGTTGGANSYSLTTTQLPSHTHTIASGGDHSHNIIGGPGGPELLSAVDIIWDWSWAGLGGYISTAGAHAHGGATGAQGSGASIDNRPAFIQLAFIMKL